MTRLQFLESLADKPTRKDKDGEIILHPAVQRVHDTAEPEQSGSRKSQNDSEGDGQQSTKRQLVFTMSPSYWQGKSIR
jgi:hypothetical protein